MRKFLSLLFSALILLVTACDPVPSRELTPEEKAADMAWLFSIFQEHYAPLRYKEELHGFKFETLKEGYLQEAMTTEGNLAFYHLVHRFVAEFQDAHTSSRFTASQLPGREQVASLGFNGYRVGDVFQVDYLLPEYRSGNSSIMIGDQIVAMNGTPLTELIDRTFSQWRHVGHEEANRTILMPKLFNRLSLNLPLPEEGEEVLLTILREGVEKTIGVHWRVQDLVAFLEEKAKHASMLDDQVAIAGMSEQEYFSKLENLIDGQNLKELMKEWIDRYYGVDTACFQFTDFTPDWRSQEVQRMVLAHDNPSTMGRTLLTQNRTVPEHAIFLDCATTFPTYITWEPYADPALGGRFVAYMYLYTFHPSTPLEMVVQELKQTVAHLQKNQITDLIIDCIDNGGGALSLALDAAQVLSASPIDFPSIQMRCSDGWLDHFERRMRSGRGHDRQLAGNVWRQLKNERQQGAHISSPWPIDILFPGYPSDRGNQEMERPFNIVCLVNERSVSCADIFPAMLQDNGLATVIGSRTMGGGGNVVNHFQSPNSHIIVSQTHSLVLRSNGEYIENIGVTPDVEMDVNADLPNSYFNIQRRGVEFLLNGDAPDEPPVVEETPIPLGDLMRAKALSWEGFSQ